MVLLDANEDSVGLTNPNSMHAVVNARQTYIMRVMRTIETSHTSINTPKLMGCDYASGIYVSIRVRTAIYLCYCTLPCEKRKGATLYVGKESYTCPIKEASPFSLSSTPLSQYTPCLQLYT